MEKKRTGPGRPAIDDSEAIAFVLNIRLMNQRIGYREASRRYFQENSEKLDGVKLESAARRVADKAMLEDGRRPNRAYLDHLIGVAFRLNLISLELQSLINRLQGELPASENRRGDRGRRLLAAITSMEVILEELRRAQFASSKRED